LLRRTYLNEDGKHPIILRISYRGENRDTFTGFFINNNFWIPKVGRVKAKEPTASVLNQKLQKMAQEASEHFDEFRYSRHEFSIDDLAEKIRGKNEPPDILYSYKVWLGICRISDQSEISFFIICTNLIWPNA